MYNKYNTRNNPGRYNTPGRFVSAGESESSPHITHTAACRQLGPALNTGAPMEHIDISANSFSDRQRQYDQVSQDNEQEQHFSMQYQQQPQQQHPLQQQQLHQQQQQQEWQQHQEWPQQQKMSQQELSQPDLNFTQTSEAMQAESMDSCATEEASAKPHWMKNKLSGVKKISNRERRRRRNENLRRLLTPKNALMVLNEILPNEQVNNQFKVEPASNMLPFSKSTPAFCADLTLNGNQYTGYGENKMSARNAAAEQAIRDLIIDRISNLDGAASEGEESLPMVQLASFALHKLFAEWECSGRRVPQLRGGAGTGPAAESAVGAEAGERPAPAERPATSERAVPNDARALHPCSLLTYMRPRAQYSELAVEGDRPQNMSFTFGVNVDNQTFIGKASNKKEARKAAARIACQELFNITFDAAPAPTPAPNN